MATAGAAQRRLRVRDLAGVPHTVLLVPGASERTVKEAIAAVVGLAVGAFGLVNDDGESTVPHSALTGDWTAVPLVGKCKLSII